MNYAAATLQLRASRGASLVTARLHLQATVSSLTEGAAARAATEGRCAFLLTAVTPEAAPRMERMVRAISTGEMTECTKASV